MNSATASSLQIQLPPVAPYLRRAYPSNGWSDQYGALQTAAAYSGSSCRRDAFEAVWQHGCFGPWVDYAPRLLTYSTPKAEDIPVYVAREDQAELLRRSGFKRAKAIGLPIVYAPEYPVSRVRGSLLVVPTHTIFGNQSTDRSLFARYAEEIADIAGEFEHVAVCLHSNCRKAGLWVDEFERLGIPVIDGANPDDQNSLLRMRMLFNQFEVVSSNGWGSHVAYALAFGCRVSIYGTEVRPDPDELLKDPTWAADRALIPAANSVEVREREATFLQRFRVGPGRAVADVELGRWLIGSEHRISPSEMGGLLSESSNVRGRRDASISSTSPLLDGLFASMKSKGLGDQVDIENLVVDGYHATALSMRPPSSLGFNLATGVRGRFTTAVTIHPDAWTNRRAGACEFHIRVNDRVVMAILLDPSNRESDRHWHEIGLDIPINSSGNHRVVLEAKGVGSSQYWPALWREPCFEPYAE